MERHLFLCSDDPCGKSRMILDTLGKNIAMAGGFLTVDEHNDTGYLMGTDLIPSASAGGYDGYMSYRLLDYSSFPPSKNNEVFSVEAVKLLQESDFYPFSVLDAFGGFELVIPQFREELLKFLHSPAPCLGVLISPVKADAIRQYLGLSEKFTDIYSQIFEELNRDMNTRILYMTRNDISAIQIILSQWANHYLLE